MAAYTGSLSPEDIVALLDTTVFDDDAVIDMSPFTVWVGDTSIYGDDTHVLPDASDIDSFDGWLAPDFADLWYGHFHIIPNRINLGNLTSQQVRPIELFNGHFVPLELSAISATDLSGVEFDLNVPETLDPLESVFRNLTVDTVGTPSFDGFFEITADDAVGTYFLYVTGQRVLVLPFQHNWNDRVIERLAWLNSSSKALDGTDQIVMLRNKPRRILDYQILLASTQTNAARLRALFQALMFGWQARTFIIPIWTDATRLTAEAAAGQNAITVPTTYFDYDVGSYIMLWKDEENYEVVEIETVSSGGVTVTVDLLRTWSAGRTVVMPARLAYVAQNLTGEKHTVDVDSLPVSFELLAQHTSANRLVAGTEVTYRGYPVLLTKNNYAALPSFGIESNTLRNDANVGIFNLDRVQPTPNGDYSYSFLFRNHAQVANYFKWLDDRKGRVGVFWYPTWSRDMQVVQDIGAASTSFLINSIGYTSLYYVNGAPAYTRRDLMITLKNGTRFFRRITGVTIDPDTDIETVGISSALGQIVTIDQIDRVCFLIPSALKADAVEIAWESGNVSQSTVMVADVYNANI
jgi:hypothetical protein